MIRARRSPSSPIAAPTASASGPFPRSSGSASTGAAAASELADSADAESVGVASPPVSATAPSGAAAGSPSLGAGGASGAEVSVEVGCGLAARNARCASAARCSRIPENSVIVFMCGLCDAKPQAGRANGLAFRSGLVAARQWRRVPSTVPQRWRPAILEPDTNEVCVAEPPAQRPRRQSSYRRP